MSQEKILENNHIKNKKKEILAFENTNISLMTSPLYAIIIYFLRYIVVIANTKITNTNTAINPPVFSILTTSTGLSVSTSSVAMFLSTTTTLGSSIVLLITISVLFTSVVFTSVVLTSVVLFTGTGSGTG